LRVSGREAGDVELKRFCARCNLALAAWQADRNASPPASLASTAIALVWREATWGAGAAKGSSPHADLLRDYGLTMAVPPLEPSTAAAALPSDYGARGQTADATRDTTSAATVDVAPAFPGRLRALGPLRIEADAYEDFLSAAEAAIEQLVAPAGSSASAATASRIADAAAGLGAGAWAANLGRVALLADALGAAWRQVAKEYTEVPGAGGHGVIASELEPAADALRRMLHQVAAGMAPSDPSDSLDRLRRFFAAQSRRSANPSLAEGD
jgi:hypothetical protein